MVKLFVAFAFLFCAVLASPSVNRCKKHLNSSSQQRIIGGINAPNHVPYLVSLRYKPEANKHWCGGAILNENWILTAAHCVKGFKRTNIQIRAGNNSLSKQSDKYDIQHIVVHKKWNSVTYKNDIALIKVTSPIKIGKRIKSIEMEKTLVQPNANANVCGWGDVDLKRRKTDYLQCLNQTITSNKNCDDKIRSKEKKLTENQICTAGQKNKAVYSGDSGSPLIMNEKIIGIVSFGTLGSTGNPTVYTRMSTYIDWVEKEMKKY